MACGLETWVRARNFCGSERESEAVGWSEKERCEGDSVCVCVREREQSERQRNDGRYAEGKAVRECMRRRKCVLGTF